MHWFIHSLILKAKHIVHFANVVICDAKINTYV